MARPKPDWKALESQADAIVKDVFTDVERLLDRAEAPYGQEPLAPAPVPVRRRSGELWLAGGALCAAALVAGLWTAFLLPASQPTTPVTGEPGPSAVVGPQTEQALLNNYAAETDTLARKLSRLPQMTAKDPFDGPVGQGGTQASLIPSLPQLRPLTALGPRPTSGAPMLRLPPAPPTFNAPQAIPAPVVPAAPVRVGSASLPVLPPPNLNLLPSQAMAVQTPAAPSLSVVPTAPLPPVAPSQPVLVGVVQAEGQQPTAVIRIGEQLRECRVGSPVKDGWFVGQIAFDHVILKRGKQQRTLAMGGD